MEEPNILLGCAVCRQSNRLKKSIKTTWKSSEALGKTLLRGRGMCLCGTDGADERGPKIIRASKPDAWKSNQLSLLLRSVCFADFRPVWRDGTGIPESMRKNILPPAPCWGQICKDWIQNNEQSSRIQPVWEYWWLKWSHLWHKVRKSFMVMQESSENALEGLSARLQASSVCCQDGGWVKISSFLQRRARQLIGQCVPALHLLALVLQTVDPVLQRVSLWVAPQGHPAWHTHTNMYMLCFEYHFPNNPKLLSDWG